MKAYRIANKNYRINTSEFYETYIVTKHDISHIKYPSFQLAANVTYTSLSQSEIVSRTVQHGADIYLYHIVYL